MKLRLSKIAAVFLTCVVMTADVADLDTSKIDSLTGLKGKLNAEEGVYKVSQPRTDINSPALI